MVMNFQDFQQIPEGEVFRVVTSKYILDSPEPMTFVCKKGGGHDDWAIYYGPADNGVSWICHHGEKLHSEDKILNIFPCDYAIFERYRP